MAKTILLADDSMTIQKVVELTFMDQDYQVVAVSDGESAMQRLDEVAPDLVIADVHMPGASGYDVCRHVKANRPGTPVLLLVGTFEQFDEQAARDAGADGDLKKPFDSQDLLGQVDRLVSGAGEPADASVSDASVPGVPVPDVPAPAHPESFTVDPAVPTSFDAEPTEPPTFSPPSSELPVQSEPVQPAPVDATPSFEPEPATSFGGPSDFQTDFQTPPSEPSFELGDAPEPATPQTFSPEPAGETEESVSFDSEPAAPIAFGAPSEPPEPVDVPQVPLADPGDVGGIPAVGALKTQLIGTRELTAAGAAPYGAAGAASFQAPAEPEPAEPESDDEPASLDAGSSHDAAAVAEAEPMAAEAPSDDVPDAAAGSAPASADADSSDGDRDAADVDVNATTQPMTAHAASDGASADGGLSDADVDRIARRVVELIGETKVRDVAWEVVPDLAEVVIKERIRELERQVESA